MWSGSVVTIKDDISIFSASGIYKLYRDNVTFRGIMARGRQHFSMQFLQHFQVLYQCSNSSQTKYSEVFISA